MSDEKKPVVMTSDEIAALRWLMGNDNSIAEDIQALDASGTFNRLKNYAGDVLGRAALVRLLHSDRPLNRDVQNALAGALTRRGSSRMIFELVLVRREIKPGRPPRPIKRLYENMQLAIDANEAAGKQKGRTKSLAIKDAATARGRSRTSAYSAMKSVAKSKT